MIATMRSPDKEKELATLPNVVLLPLDITDPEQIARAANDALARGEVDVVFNNAGYGMAGPLEGVTDEQMLRMVNTNLMGPIRVTKAFIPHFRAKRAGLFINTTSIGGLITVPFNSMYHATKWALEGWSEAMAFELNQFGIGMKIIEPGGMKTDFFTRSFDVGRHPDYDALVTRVMSAITDPKQMDTLFDSGADRRGRVRGGNRRQGSAPLRGRRRRQGDLCHAPAARRRSVSKGDGAAVFRRWRTGVILD